MVIFKLLLLLGIRVVFSNMWINDFDDKECYHCSRYERDKANFSSILPLQDGGVIVGAKNTIYKIQFDFLQMIPYLDEVKGDSAAQSAYKSCKEGGRPEAQCQNYYKVLVRINMNEVMVCGTQSYVPTCDIRQVSNLRYKARDHMIKGEAICPPDPHTPTTVLVLRNDQGIGFSATCLKECTDYQISRINLQPSSLSVTGKTFHTSEWLNSPTFVYSFEEGNFSYFLFYETAIEERSEKVYSRIARVCKNDVGSGQDYFKNYFLSFSKARIYCTSNQPGETPFNHNEIGGAYYTDNTLYTVFSGPRNLRTGSILCAFSIRDIDEVFNGPYLIYNKDSRKWEESTAEKEQFSCSKKKSVEFARVATLMAKPIYQTSPLYYTKPDTRLTSVMVTDISLEDTNYTIIYAASEQGTIARVGLEAGLSGNIHSTVVTAGPVEPITSLTLSHSHDMIYALSDNWITRVPTVLESACHQATTCSECLNLFYPYCSWCYSNGALRCIAEQSECKVTELVKPTDTCAALPVFGVEPRNKVVRRGSTVAFTCRGREGEQAQWARENRAPISRAATYTSDSLILPMVELSDMGCYLCMLNNTSGRVSMKACLNVTEKPVFVMQPENVSAFEEDINIELQCRASGSPQPRITWFKEGGTIPQGSEVTDDGYLRIYRVLPRDEGYYWCTASNTVGTVDSRRGFLKISNGAMEKTDEDPNSVIDGISTTTVISMVVAGVIIAIVCFAVGLVVHKLYRKHMKKRETDIGQSQHVYEGHVHTQGGIWTPVNTLPYQMCRQEGDWRDSGMYSGCTLTHPPPLPYRPDLLGQLTQQRVGHVTHDTLLEEDEAPPAYDDRHSDSPPLLPATPVSLQAPVCFGTSCRPGGRYTPTHHFNTCPTTAAGPHPPTSGTYCTPHNLTHSPLIPPPTTTTTSSSHYTPLNNSDYAVISQPSAEVPRFHRQYSRDIDVQAACSNSHHFTSDQRQLSTQRPLDFPSAFHCNNI